MSKIGAISRSGVLRKSNESMRLIVTTFVGVVFGFLLGVSFPASLSRLNITSRLMEDTNTSISTEQLLHHAWSSMTGQNESSLTQVQTPNDTSKIWVSSNPRGAERLPPGIVVAESDFYSRRLWGKPSEDLTTKPKYLVTFTVGLGQKSNIDAAVKKFSGNFTIMLFHYDGRMSEWDDLEWSKQAIHVSVLKQTKWWYAKIFLHPDVVAAYEYIFIWDEDLGVEHFDAEEYLKLVRKHGLEISQPGLDPDGGTTWQMTKRRETRRRNQAGAATPICHHVQLLLRSWHQYFHEMHGDVWHMIQNDLVHGWGLDFALRKCVETAHEKIGIVDAQWIVHQTVPSLGNQVIGNYPSEFRLTMHLLEFEDLLRSLGEDLGLLSIRPMMSIVKIRQTIGRQVRRELGMGEYSTTK